MQSSKMNLEVLRRAIRRALNGYFIASFLLSIAQTVQLVDAAGKSLSFAPHCAGDFWLSEGGNYTFGFKDVGDGVYLLSIWHSADPSKTAIWWADFEDNPVVKDGASFNYHTSKGILQLYNASSVLVWNSSNTGTSTVDFQDTGNLRLLKDNSEVVWQSFEDRRDSLMLVGLEDGMLRNRPRLLRSRRNQSSYAAGRFHLATDESLLLYLYENDQSNNEFLYMKETGMNSSEGVRIGKRYDNSASASDRLVLDYDGNLRVYGWQSSVPSWIVKWEYTYSTKCQLGSPCCPFGICSTSHRDAVNCSCPPGYHARVAGDNTQACASNTEINATTGYLTNGFSRSSIIPERTLLIKDVSPKVSVGRKGVPKWVIGVGLAVTVLVRVAVGCAWQESRSGGVRWSWTKTVKNVGDVVSGNGPVRFTYQELVEATDNFRHPLGEGGFAVVYKGLVRGKSRSVRANEQPPPPVAVAVKVLKGLATGAAKKRKKQVRGAQASQGEKQFIAEVSTLGKIHHVNLVKLLGYCATSGRDGEKWLLVYEYMENGSLDIFLSRVRMQQPLPWSIRYSIALGTARGIAYLHDGCNPRILHCDIKPQNVLLDRDFTAKVADFGLAKCFHNRESLITMSNMKCGTFGYMAPEWLRTDEITTGVDVYSFGMLLLDLVHGLHTGSDHLPLLHWAFRCISAGVLLPQVQAASAANVSTSVNATSYSSSTIQGSDPDDSVSSVLYTTNSSFGQQEHQQEDKEKLRLLKVVLWCVHPTPSTRPLMSQVVQLIDGTVAVESPPDPCAFTPLLSCGYTSTVDITNNSLSYSLLFSGR